MGINILQPQLGLPLQERRHLERPRVVSGDRWVIGVDPKVPELSRIALRTTHVSQAGANTRPELTTIPARY